MEKLKGFALKIKTVANASVSICDNPMHATFTFTLLGGVGDPSEKVRVTYDDMNELVAKNDAFAFWWRKLQVLKVGETGAAFVELEKILK